MVGTKNPFIVDRTTYSFRGKWQNPNQDKETDIFYFISQPMTFAIEYKNGKEQMIPKIEITIFGEHPISVCDHITLQNGETYMVEGILLNYKEHNIAVRDMLKPVIESMVLTLK